MAEKRPNNAIVSIIVIFSLYAFISQYAYVSIIAGLALATIVALLWTPRIPPMLPYLFAYQFLQIFGAIWYADFLHQPLDSLYESIDSEFLVMFTLIQLVLMAGLASFVFKMKKVPGLDDLRAAVMELDVKKVLTAYVITSLFFPILISATRSISSVSQLIQSFAVIKKLFLIMLLFIVFLRKTQYRNLIIFIFIAEFILSFVSYFSSFKEIFVYILIAYLTVFPNIKTKAIVRLLPFVVFVVVLMVFWSSIKNDYRNYLNQGSRQQEISVSTSDALNYVADQAEAYDANAFSEGGEILLHRMQYMQQYSSVYSRVPSVIPFDEGKNTSSALTFLLMPRTFSDNKGILDPSTKASYYTGKTFTDAAHGTSISMGYFCDFYIDFGLWGMIIPLLIIAFGIGKAASYIMNNKRYNLIFTYCLFIAVFMSLGTFESDIIFYLGSIRNYVVVLLLGNWLIFPRLNKYIKA
ncbi:MAG: hypothetical protein JST70_05115 [Bacteroidetes bacterium]|nr:hypothetical protein [Bacteroidota bacterium]